MSAISALKNKIAAKNEEVSKKAEEMTNKAQEIARLNEEHMAIREEFKELNLEADQLNEKLARLEELAAEEAEILASVTPVTPAPAAVAQPVAEPVAEPVPSDVAVFSTVAIGSVKKGHVTIADSKDFVACGYYLAVDCAEPFSTKSEKEFKEQIKAVQKIDGSGLVGGSAAKKVHTFMKSGTENIGKIIIVAYDKGIGGGGEVRKITGPYYFSPMNTLQEDTIACYFHRFPTEFIRKLTPDEFNQIASVRPARAINWTTRLVL